MIDPAAPDKESVAEPVEIADGVGRDVLFVTQSNGDALGAAQLQTRVVDRAMQVFGAMGLAPDTPLAYLWT